MYKYLWDMLQLFTAVLLGVPFGTQCYESQLERTGQVDKSGPFILPYFDTYNATFFIAPY